MVSCGSYPMTENKTYKQKERSGAKLKE